jgi:hypothetical protein
MVYWYNEVDDDSRFGPESEWFRLLLGHGAASASFPAATNPPVSWDDDAELAETLAEINALLLQAKMNLLMDTKSTGKHLQTINFYNNNIGKDFETDSGNKIVLGLSIDQSRLFKTSSAPFFPHNHEIQGEGHLGKICRAFEAANADFRTTVAQRPKERKRVSNECGRHGERSQASAQLVAHDTLWW